MLQRLTRTETGRGRSVDLGRPEQVVVRDGFRRRAVAHGHEVAERHHASVRRPHIVAGDVVRLRAKLLVRLHVDAVRTVVEVEIVDVGRTEQHLHRVGDVAQRHAEALGLRAVDVNQQLRIVGGELREQTREPRRLVRLTDQLIGGRFEILDRPAALIEQFVGEAAERAETVDRRRQNRKDLRAGNLAETAEQLSDDRLRRFARALPFLEILQRQEADALVRRRAGEAEAARGEHPVRLGNRLHDVLDLMNDAHRVVERGPLRRLDDDEHVALIRVGHESGRHDAEHLIGRGKQSEKDERDDPPGANQDAQRTDHQARAALEQTVEAAEEKSRGRWRRGRAEAPTAPASASAR